MKITVKLYATLSRYNQGKRAGTPLEMELPEESTLQNLIGQLKIPLEETRITFVNGIIQEPEYRLNDGDEVGIFPPIGGG
jgi:molybdopterin converting factor small subunit